MHFHDTNATISDTELGKLAWSLIESESELADFIQKRACATMPLKVTVPARKWTMTPAILYALQQTSKQGPIHHIVRELDPESTKDFTEKGDYLSLQNKIKAIVGRTKASRKQLSRRTLAEQCSFMNHPFREGLPKVQAASKKSGMESGKKRKASNGGEDES